MKKVGIVLIIIQVLALFGGLVSHGTLIPEGNIFVIIGYFLPAIIGVILLIKSSNKPEK